MFTISIKEYQEVANEIKKISKNLWNNLHVLLDQLDEPRMNLFLLRLHELLMENVSSTIWIVWETETEFSYIITCEIIELLDGYLDIQEGENQRKDVRKYWWIKKLKENE